MPRFSVVVGNVGYVHDGDNKAEAHREYREWVAAAKCEFGRAAGEAVTLMCDGEPIKEHHETTKQSC